MTLQFFPNQAAVASLESFALSNRAAVVGVPAASDQVCAALISLCTGDWARFLHNKNVLRGFSQDLVRAEALRLLEKNPRSFKMLSFVSRHSFFTDWDLQAFDEQMILFSAVAMYSVNADAKETTYHQALKTIRKQTLSQQNSKKPTKLRLRDCHGAIANFIYEFASGCEINRSIAIASLLECETSGCGHLPSQQAVALLKRLERF